MAISGIKGCFAAWLVVLIAGASGCSMTMTLGPTVAATQPCKAPGDVATVTPAKPKYLPDSTIDSDPGEAPVINFFGELTRGGGRRGIAAPALLQHTFLDSGHDADVSVDPSGQWMAYSSAREGGKTQIFLQRVDGTAITQLTSTAADDAQPCFSPDGKRIAFCSNRSGRWHVYVMNADGRGVTQLTDGPSNDMHPSFSPEGTRLVYSSLPGNAVAGEWQLFVADLISRDKLAIGPGLFPSWSPDKTHNVIAFQKTRARGSRWFSIWTCELHGTEPTAPTEVAVSTDAALVSPTWSPNGRAIAYAAISGAGQKARGPQDIWVMSADGSNARRLTDGTATNLTPCWTVQNRVYFVSDRSGHECIWSLPAMMQSLTAPAKEMEPSSAATDSTELKP
jgi:TolB protein